MKIILKKGATIYLKEFLAPHTREKIKIQTDKEVEFHEPGLNFRPSLKRRVYFYNVKDSVNLPVYDGKQIISIEWEPTNYNETIIE